MIINVHLWKLHLNLSEHKTVFADWTASSVIVSSVVMLVNTSAPAENVSDVSPVNNETAVTTVKPTTAPPSTSHESTSSIHLSTLHPTSTAAGTSPVQAKARADTPSALNVADDGTRKQS